MLYNLAISLTRSQKRALILSIDVVLVGLSYALACWLLLGLSWIAANPGVALRDMIILLVMGGAVTTLMGLHKIKLNAYEMQGVIESAFVAVMLIGTGVLAALIMPTATPAHVFAVAGMLFLILSVMARLSLRTALLRIYRRGNPQTRLLIYGAGHNGQQLATALATDERIRAVAFVDDDPRLQSLSIAGLRVHAPAEIDEVIARHAVDRIVLAMPKAPASLRSNLTERLRDTGCEVHALPSFADLVSQTATGLADTRPVDVNELLGREHLGESLSGVQDIYLGRRVLVTGAGGSIGAELCRQLILCRPETIILIDHSEHSLFQIHRELANVASGIRIEAVLGSVCDKQLMTMTMQRWHIDIVLHAAAYKHVPLVEDNAIEGMRNNVLGTKITADAAEDAQVERFILVSTDKAVRPTSVMGASKRMAELVVQDLATRSKVTRFSMVRFGNVLGSSGSVIPLFQEQIANGGPVTLTHSDVTRYFMTIPEAVSLVLLAGSYARGGDVFVLDMGKPVPVRQIARQMIEGAGLTVRDGKNPDGDIEIRITGLRPGEKLHEELMIGSDMMTTAHPKILRALEGHLSEIEMAQALKSLRQAIEARDVDVLFETMAKWIEKSRDKVITVNE
jgi:FlaA1/EpsC-like NDP-sugar epimerase